jgi:hypothetical protein
MHARHIRQQASERIHTRTAGLVVAHEHGGCQSALEGLGLFQDRRDSLELGGTSGIFFAIVGFGRRRCICFRGFVFEQRNEPRPFVCPCAFVVRPGAGKG